MKKLVTLLLILGSILIFNNLSAQTKTPYEKKKEALSVQFFKDLGVSPATIKKYVDAGEIGGIFLLGNISEKLNTEKGMLLLLKYNNDIKNAEKLKNATDFKRDEEKRLAEQRKKEAEQAKQRERENQQELARQEEQRQRDFKNSDYYKLATDIKEEFEKWASKGEFEKTLDYDNRINNDAKQKFTNICFNKIYNKIGVYESTYNSERSNYDYPIKIDLGEYDADNEQFNATLTAYRNYSDKDIANTTIKVPMNEAKSFKESFSLYSYRLLVNTNDWSFENHNFLPKKITIKKIKGENLEKSYTAITQTSANENIVFQSENLKIENLNATFNYNQQAPIIFENIRKKQLEIEEQKRKELELKKKQEDEIKFNQLVASADRLQSNKPEKLKSKDVSGFGYTNLDNENNNIIKYYQNALSIKEDKEVREKLEKCLEYKEELKTLYEKTKKKEKTLKTINSILR